MLKWLFKAVVKEPIDKFRILQIGDRFYPQKLSFPYPYSEPKGTWACFQEWPMVSPFNGWHHRNKSNETYTIGFDDLQSAQDWLFKQIAKEEYEAPKVVLEFETKKPPKV